MSFAIEVAGAMERDAACRLLVAHRLPEDRYRAAQRYSELFSSGELDPAGLFVAKSPSGSVCGAMLVSRMPGALGLAWPPVTLRNRNRIELEDALTIASCAWLKERGVKVCQAFGREEERDTFAPLERAGFENFTSLVELRRDLVDEPASESRMTFERLNASNRDPFSKALLESFEGSLDCPEVNGSRTEVELLGTYADPNDAKQPWFLARLEGEPVGVLLLEMNIEPGSCELTYLGIAPGFRRRGLGAELMRFALHSARNLGQDTMLLSVDKRNLPARGLYETLGFQGSGERFVFLAGWPSLS